jgi:DNA-binding MarR family transcriptional regulator
MTSKELPFGFDTPHDSPGFLLWQTTVVWQRHIKHVLQPYEVSHPQFVILALLLWLSEHRHETNQVQIAQYSKLDKMTVSQALKKLTLQGLVHRSEHEADTRAKHVMLTAQGIELVQKLVPLVEGVDAQFFGRLSKDAEQTLIKTLGPLVEGAG